MSDGVEQSTLLIAFARAVSKPTGSRRFCTKWSLLPIPRIVLLRRSRRKLKGAESNNFTRGRERCSVWILPQLTAP